MSSLTSLIPGVRTLRYVLIAAVAFSLGGATVVQAVAPSGILGTIRIADGAIETQLAKVDNAGSLQVKVSNPTTSQEVTGHVDVDNFPSSQTVNGTVSTLSSLATRMVTAADPSLEPGESNDLNITPAINVSLIIIDSDDDVSFEITSPGLGVFSLNADSVNREILLTQRIPVTKVHNFCRNLVVSCTYAIRLIGN